MSTEETQPELFAAISRALEAQPVAVQMVARDHLRRYVIQRFNDRSIFVQVEWPRPDRDERITYWRDGRTGAWNANSYSWLADVEGWTPLTAREHATVVRGIGRSTFTRRDQVAWSAAGPGVHTSEWGAVHRGEGARARWFDFTPRPGVSGLHGFYGAASLTAAKKWATQRVVEAPLADRKPMLHRFVRNGGLPYPPIPEYQLAAQLAARQQANREVA